MVDAASEQMDMVSILTNKFETEFENFIRNIRYLIVSHQKSEFERRVVEFRQKTFKKSDANQPPSYTVQLSEDLELDDSTDDMQEEINAMKNEKRNHEKNGKIIKKLEKINVSQPIIFPSLKNTSLKTLILECNNSFKEIDNLNSQIITAQFFLL